VTTNASNEATVDQSLAEVTFSGPLFAMPTGPVNVAMGSSTSATSSEYVPDRR